MTGGNTAPDSLRQARERLAHTREMLRSGDDALLAGLIREDLLGGIFHAGLLVYFAQYPALGHLMAPIGGNH